ncbi:MAG: type IV pilus secretin PilQ [Deltaproteobacteria bacterium]|nr:type IV pilus secretin PilQ [Deltaproteobacteria bacterium]
MYKRSFLNLVIFLIIVCGAYFAYGESNGYDDISQIIPLKDVSLKKEGRSIKIHINIGAVVPYYVTLVENPKRLVVDLEKVRINRGLKEKKFFNTPIERMRIGRHQTFTRLVFDLGKSIEYSSFSTTVDKGNITILLEPVGEKEKKIKIEPVVNVMAKVKEKEELKEGSSNASLQSIDNKSQNASTALIMETSQEKGGDSLVQKSESKVVTKLIDGITKGAEISKDESSKIKLTGINVRQYNGYSRIVISFDSDVRVNHNVIEVGEKEVQLKFDRCIVSESVMPVIDKVERFGPISMIRVVKDKNEGGCSISVYMKERVPQHLVRENKNVNWDFFHVEKPQEIKFSEEMVASEEKGEASEKYEDYESKKTYKGKRISMDFKDANIHNILRLISEVAKINIVTSDDVKGNVTVTLRNVPWDQALEIILKTKGLGMKKVGNIIRVAPVEVFQKEAEAEMAKKKALEALEPLKVRLIPVNYGYAKDIVAQVKDVLSDRGTINIDERTNVIIIKDKIENIIKAEGLIRSLDTQTPQVLIEARIVEANTSFIRDIGIQWGGNMVFAPQYGNPTGLTFPNVVGINGGADDARTMNQFSGVQNPAGFAVNMPAPVGAGAGGAIGFILGNASGSANLNLRLSALENTGHVKILSAPRVTTLDNKEAKISSGVSIPISQVSAAGVMTVFVDAKLELAVTPHVTQDGSIMLKIVTTKNEPDFSRTGAQGDPTILKKEAFTQVLVKDGDTTVIGGIYTRRQSEEFAKVPLLSNIPVLGWLFKKKKSADERTELLIFITPRIVNRAEAIMQQKS